MKKKIFLLLLIMIMICPSFVKAVGDITGAGGTDYVDSDPGSVNVGKPYGWGCFGNSSDSRASMRVTVVDANGERLQLNVGGKNYKSRTLDYYDDTVSNAANARHEKLFERNDTDGKNADDEPKYYMYCGRVEQGENTVPTLCMRKDYENESGGKKFRTQNNKNISDNKRHYNRFNNSYKNNLERKWKSIFGGSVPNEMKIPYAWTDDGQKDYSIENIISNFISSNKKNYTTNFEKLFEQLMGISIEDIKTYNGSQCGNNQVKLNNAFVIFEPVTAVSGHVTFDGSNPDDGSNKSRTGILLYGSATELALFTYDSKGVCHQSNPHKYQKEVLPNVYGAISLNNTGKPKNFNNEYNFYYKNVGGKVYGKKKGENKDVNVAEWLKKDGSRADKTVGSGNIKYGFGLGVLHFKQAEENLKLSCFDYSIDAACTDCSSKNEDNAAYIIQDTTNWNAIDNIDPNSNPTDDLGKCIKNHFVKDVNGAKVKCREEYHVFLPNQRNKITVQAGRYFTLNKNSSDTGTLTIPNDIPDFRPISITKTRYCKGTESALNTFSNVSKNDFKCVGDIYVSYDEGLSDSKYKYNNKMLKAYGGNYSSSNKNGVLIQTITNYYTLDDYVFRYIRIKDGLVESDKRGSKEHIDLNVSTLPVSYRNSASNKIKVSFRYSLPTCDKYSNMAGVYSEQECSLRNEGNEGINVYKDYLNKTNDSGEKIEDSACVKLYGAKYLNSNLPETSYNKEQRNRLLNCINSRKEKEDKRGNCVNSIKTFSNDVVKNNESKEGYTYTCFNDVSELKPGKPTIPKCPEGTTYDPTSKTCDPNNGNTHFCEKVEDNYYNKTGVVVSKEEYENSCCSQKNTFGRTWNPNDGGYCCPKDQPYNELTGKCESPCKKLSCEKNANGAIACCVDGNNTPSCGYWSSSGRVICPGKPSLSSLVYRTIDPLNPLVTQNGSTREAGLNWCSYNSKGVLKCGDELENYVVTEVLKKNVTNDSEAIYKVTLTPDSINRIRSYNDSNKYDDWDLECDANGKNCKSKFLHDSNFKLGLDGKCKDIINGNDCEQ